MNDDQYGLLFDVRRSARYHDRRRAFFERLHRLTGALTVLLAGTVLFDLARPGPTAWWLTLLAAMAAVLAALDMVVGYAMRAGQHRDLKARFVDLEMSMLAGDDDASTWAGHWRDRLAIERDEPPVYRALDLLCYNEVLHADGHREPERFVRLSRWQRWSSHFLHWSDIARA
jgi:hypothetical protein